MTGIPEAMLFISLNHPKPVSDLLKVYTPDFVDTGTLARFVCVLPDS
jgi:hypothetical protein